ncbi:DUF6653 family protein [Salinigranum sp. GCM10025319]|uniref:DUF6653 family protein n=1 Tax=Salinigranum sp. GCM10025319 TaxID=3252687 RepID=UPI00361F127B
MVPHSTRSIRDRLEAAFWERHANPWSSGTRFLTMPALLYAIHTRDRRLFAATVAFVVVNPVLFPPPAETDSWLSRIVLAEREWLGQGKGTMGLDYPNVLNLLNAPATLLALWAAWRRKPIATLVAGVTAMALKVWWVDAIARRTEAGRSGGWDGEPGPR